MLKKLASASLIAIFGNIIALAAFAMLMGLIGCLHGDTGSHSISGSPALDSANMGYWLHWTHIAFYYFPFLEIVTIGLAIALRVAAGSGD